MNHISVVLPLVVPDPPPADTLSSQLDEDERLAVALVRWQRSVRAFHVDPKFAATQDRDGWFLVDLWIYGLEGAASPHGHGHAMTFAEACTSAFDALAADVQRFDAEVTR